ncbi:hypothetical protein VCHA48O428_100159 [Vibrio chagasii]|nr:hypothetical protein VCHA27O13_60190 [Vibrio chagasii]CAH6811014.1 hypothetical protein VCHA34O109_110180 [Vibrio chagasii]CAH6889514.1 hypothetical protein VCHA42P256_100021 [Vibrio chagasii]CAH6916298.1 hypothetical protein VCHA43P272_120126 [Vibrio chagasii]CAH6928975.1 hypothetical protein VCHA48O428_100159 [Vibrio chagasii]
MLSFFNNARYLSGNSANPILNNNLLNILLTNETGLKTKQAIFHTQTGLKPNKLYEFTRTGS